MVLTPTYHLCVLPWQFGGLVEVEYLCDDVALFVWPMGFFQGDDGSLSGIWILLDFF